jgi:hypothetical protein
MEQGRILENVLKFMKGMEARGNGYRSDEEARDDLVELTTREAARADVGLAVGEKKEDATKYFVRQGGNDVNGGHDRVG